MPKKTFSIISLGCFRNTYDSEVVAQKLYDSGYVLKDNPQGCNLLVINTCGFIDKAKQESIEVIEKAVDLKKKKQVEKIMVFGCLVQRYRKYLEKYFPEVDQWRPVEPFTKAFLKRKSLNSCSSDFLKICEGCLNNCSFCAIPFIKGSLVSRPADEVIKEARCLDKKGIKELNIIGQDITSWGRDFKNKRDLSFLIKKILKETGIRWIRLVYTHPRSFSDSLIGLIANEERICKYIDLPIQHINDRILKAMNRGITRKATIDLIRRIRKAVPGCVIRSSVIAGFPGETEKEFKELLAFLKDIKFERLGAFTYSREEGTAAYNLKPQVHPATKRKRQRMIMEQQKEISRLFNSSFIGRELEVLVEAKATDTFAPIPEGREMRSWEHEISGIGITPHALTGKEFSIKPAKSRAWGLIARSQYDGPCVDGVVFIRKKNLKPGQFYRTKIIDAYDYDLVGV